MDDSQICRRKIRAFVLFFVGTLGMVLALSLPAAAQQRNETVREALFGELEQRFAEAETTDLAVLSPKNFEEATKAYEKALEDYQRGRSLEQIERKIAESTGYLEAATTSAASARQLLEEPLTMRRALFANGVASNDREIRDAERKLVDAARETENGRIPDVRRKAAEAAREYRKATLKILKDDWWKQTQAQLRQRRNSVPQQQYRNAETSLKAIESHLESLDEDDPFSVGDLLRDTRRDLDAVLAQVR